MEDSTRDMNSVQTHKECGRPTCFLTYACYLFRHVTIVRPYLPLRFWAHGLRPTVDVGLSSMEGVGAYQECKHPTPQMTSHMLLHWRTLSVTCYLPFRWGCLVNLESRRYVWSYLLKKGPSTCPMNTLAHADFAAQFRWNPNIMPSCLFTEPACASCNSIPCMSTYSTIHFTWRI